VVLFCLIVPKHHAFLFKTVVILSENILIMWNTNVDLPINFVSLCKRYFIMSNSIVDLSKDRIDMSYIYRSKHRLIMWNNGGIVTNHGYDLLKR
jgi:hypothetical protein